MKVIIPGHLYQVANFENKEDFQTIQFIQKEPVSEGSKDLKTISDGTTNEEILEALIDRMEFLNEKFACPENDAAISNLKSCRGWLNRRTENRLKRQVEGTNEI